MQKQETLVVKTVFELQDDCLALVKALKEILVREKSALIGLDTDTVVETNAKKDFLGNQLKAKKGRMWILLKHQYALEDSEGLEEKLTGEWRAQWLEKKAAWLKHWEETIRLIESNQRFLKHSLKNFDLLADNLKRLLGQQPLYSAKGLRVDSMKLGKMVEAKY